VNGSTVSTTAALLRQERSSTLAWRDGDDFFQFIQQDLLLLDR